MILIDKGKREPSLFMILIFLISWQHEYEQEQPTKRHRGQKQRNNDGWK